MRETKLNYEFGPFRLSVDERTLWCNETVVRLTPKVFDILLVLVENGGHILSKEKMMRLVWPDTSVEEGNLSRNISTLRKALDERSSKRQYIETIPWRGYRFIAEVREARGTVSRPTEAIAVLPFINESADPDAEFLSDGITDSLIDNLSRISQIRIIAHNSVFHYKSRDANAPIDARLVGRELGVQFVVVGRVVQRGDSLLTRIELVDARDNSHIWSAGYDRNVDVSSALPEVISRDIVEHLSLRLSRAEKQSFTKHYTESTTAYQLYLKGRYFWNKLVPDAVQKGIEYFEKAIAEDPGYALAYVGLVDCYNYINNPAEARKAATQALALDEALGEAHASMAFLRWVYDWDWIAEKEFRRALELKPNYALARHWFAIYLANMDRGAEALREAEFARALDPLSLLINMTPGLVLYTAHRFDEAIEELLKVIEMDRNFPAAHSVLGLTYLQKGMYKEAIAEHNNVLDVLGNNPTVAAAIEANIAHVYASSGRTREAVKMLNRLLPQSGSPSCTIAAIYAALGEKEKAFEWLNRAYAEHSLHLVSLKVDPTLDHLRQDARFVDLSRRVGLN